MSNENELSLRCDNIESAAIEALNRVHDIQLTLNELSNQFRTLQYDFNIQNRSKGAVNTPPETVPLDRTNGALRPLKWCMVTADMVH